MRGALALCWLSTSIYLLYLFHHGGTETRRRREWENGGMGETNELFITLPLSHSPTLSLSPSSSLRVSVPPW
jgi:hypothetical protein